MNRLPPARGFALIVTIVLVAMLVLVLVGLATFTRVETTVAANSQTQQQARQNALMAMNVAIGQLQKHAGPDQRVTTTADLVASTDKSGNATPAALYPAQAPRIAVQPGARHWTAAWGNNEQNIGYNLRPDQIPPTAGNRRGVTPALLNWLVSGNESAAFSASGTLGGVTAGSGLSFRPDDPVDLSDPSNPTINGSAAVLLVGPNSVGTHAAAAQDYVVAPLVEISAEVPGLAAAAPIGRYAWWVGDEGVKARVNLQNGYQQSGQSSDQIHSFLTAQRSGVEFTDFTAPGATPATPLGSAYDFTSPALGKILSGPQLPFLAADNTARDRLSDAVKHRFHDLTLHSRGVLSDTYAGGLKKDLTADIADTSSNFSYRPADNAPVFTPLSGAEAYLPTWGHFRTWARTHPGMGGEIAPTPASDTAAGIGPVLQYSALGYDLRVHSDRSVRVAVFPVVALYNPYPVAIAAARYDFGFKLTANARMTIQTAARGDPINWVRRGEIDWGVPEIRPDNSTGTQSNDFVFTVDGQTIPPGESHIYYLADSASGNPYSPGLVLTRAPAGETANPLNYVYLPGTLVLDAEVIITDPAPSAEDPNPTPTSHLLRVLTTQTGDSPGTTSSQWGQGNAPFATVTLAREGGVNNSAAWFQRSRVFTGISGVARSQLLKFDNDIQPANFTMATADPLFRISKTENWADETQGPRGALRFSVRNTSSGDYNAADRTGMPQISTIWLRHSNFRAPYGQLSSSEANAPRTLNRRGNMIAGATLANDSVSTRNVILFPRAHEFALGMAGTLDAGNPARLATFFDILEGPESLLSLGQLQHVPWARYSFHTSYPFANSMAELRIPRPTHYRTNNVARPETTPAVTDPTYDLSWHLNRAIWDRYFLSTAPASLTQAAIDSGAPLPNSRLRYFATGGATSPQLAHVRHSSSAPGSAYDRAAANLLNAGAFNINSTSEQAWRAVLSGTRGIPQDNAYSFSGDNVDEIIPFARFSRSLRRDVSPTGLYPAVDTTMVIDTANFARSFYHGNRGLRLPDIRNTASTNDSAENLVRELARTMVAQVRTRGPFLSLADFVNRSMSDTPHELGIKGALQSAIDNMASSQANPFEQWRTASNLALSHNSYYQNDVSAYAYPDWDPEHFIGGTIATLQDNPERSAFRLQYAHAPKYLTQADVLSTIGPALSARSDTFTIRSYGEVLDPVNSTADNPVVIGRAWCEAVVQRVPDYVGGEAPETSLADLPAASPSRTFGRQFRIVSFRWLSPSDL